MVKVDRVIVVEMSEDKLTLTVEWDNGYEYVDGRPIKVCPDRRKLEIDRKLFRELRD